ncbi:MAG: recombinase family protein [Calothrix sp. FI2-JRJ7]|jgi:DNA invertase Pin-like site-specific DNA recombinase|nr:recombinase family protein [Calothrix sp. FI2-JRJ7]
MVVVGYARLSSTDQAAETGLEQQIDRLKRAGAEHIYIDIKSGRSTDRPQFQELMSLVQQNRISELLITRIDRLSRSMPDFFKTVQTLKKHNVNLRVLESSIDFSTAVGRLNIATLAIYAQFESELLSDRVRHGNAYIRSQKKSFKPIFGYTRTREGILIPDETINQKTGLSNSEVAKQIIKLLCEQPLRSCCRIIYEVYDIKISISGLKKWLMNPSLRGHTHYYYFQDKQIYYKDKENIDPILHYNTHTPLMSEEEFERINQNLSTNRTFRGRSPNKGKYPLAGLGKCALCGGGLVREIGKSKKRTEFLRCGKHAKGDHFCPNKKYIHLRKVIENVIEKIIEHSQQLITMASDATNQEQSTESPEILELRTQLSNLRGMNSRNPAILNAITDLETQLHNALARAKMQPQNKDDDYLELVHKVGYAAFWESLDDDFTQEVFKELVSKFTTDESGNITVELKF